MDFIYMDAAATSKPSAAAAEAVSSALLSDWANPSSTHKAGAAAAAVLRAGRSTIASALGAGNAGRVIFTSGGTEANNLALRSFAQRSLSARGISGRGKVIITDGEHSSVEETASYLESVGTEVIRIPSRGGVLDLDFLEKNADENVSAAALMIVNNETGAVYDVRSAIEMIRRKCPGALIHCDAVQAFMKMQISPLVLGADSMSVSSHKVHGPKGVGALWIADELVKRRRIVPLSTGGEQEMSLRPGTENVPGIAGFGAAVREDMQRMEKSAAAVGEVREALISALGKTEGVRLNVPPRHIGGILSVTLPGIKSEVMLNYLSGCGVCVSAGSACHAASGSISKVLLAYGMDRREADCTVRLSFDDYNTVQDAEAAAEAIAGGVGALARMR
jgi:cysteine desulfurase